MTDARLLDWLKTGLRQPGKSARDLATALKVHPSQISRLLRGERDLKIGELIIVMDYLDMPLPKGFPLVSTAKAVNHVQIRGELAEGVWRDNAMVEPAHHSCVAALHSSQYPAEEQFAFILADDHAKTFAPRGAYILCVSFDTARRPPLRGDIIVVEERFSIQSDSKGNTILKRYLRRVLANDGEGLRLERLDGATSPQPERLRFGSNAAAIALVLGYTVLTCE